MKKMEKLEEKKRELIRKADNAQKAGDIETMKYYDREIERINKILYEDFKIMENKEKIE